MQIIIHTPNYVLKTFYSCKIKTETSLYKSSPRDQVFLQIVAMTIDHFQIYLLARHTEKKIIITTLNHLI